MSSEKDFLTYTIEVIKDPESLLRFDDDNMIAYINEEFFEHISEAAKDQNISIDDAASLIINKALSSTIEAIKNDEKYVDKLSR